MMKGVIMAVMQAEQLMLDGNLWFLKNRFDAAIEAYTEAITLCPDVANYWTSRALCHRKRKYRLDKSLRRTVKKLFNLIIILSRKKKSKKAHYMLGLALIHRKNYPEGIKALEKSLDLARGAHPHSYMVEEIWQELARAKYQQWEQDSIQRSWDLQNLKSDIEIAILEYHSHVEGFTDEITDSVSRKLQALNSVFSKASQSDTPTEIPDYLCCRITLDIFCDPVIAPSGLTYERAVILKHLHKVGMFDPITRQPLDPSQLVENMAIKEAVRAFLKTHGWAYRID
ncbi:hypothetical protein LXL04_016830 [Taraxacum kok-saghyz]